MENTDRGVSLLLVNDEVILRDALAALLVRAGFAVAQASSGAGALTALRSSRFDLIHIDLDPEKSALATRMIRREFPSLPIVEDAGTTRRTLQKIATTVWAGQSPADLCRKEALASELRLVPSGV